MVLFNHSTRELTAKIVYYGPGLCGKTTNLQVLHDKLEKGTAGRLLSLATSQDRTIYFDLLPVELGNIKGYTVRFQLCTVPGQVFYNETRKLVLRGVDGIVFVVDSQWSMLSHAHESYLNLKENLREIDVSPESVPLVIQYNKRDLPAILSVDALQEALSFQSYPHVEAVASAGKGVMETYKLISKLTFVDLLRRLQRGGSAEADAASALLASAGSHPAFNGEKAHTPAPAEAQKPRSGEAKVPSPTAKVSPQVVSSRETWSSLVTEDDVFGETVPPRPKSGLINLPSATSKGGAILGPGGPGDGAIGAAATAGVVTPVETAESGSGAIAHAAGEAPGEAVVAAEAPPELPTEAGTEPVAQAPEASGPAHDVPALRPTAALERLAAAEPDGDVFDLSFPSAMRSVDLTFPPAPRSEGALPGAGSGEGAIAAAAFEPGGPGDGDGASGTGAPRAGGSPGTATVTSSAVVEGLRAEPADHAVGDLAAASSPRLLALEQATLLLRESLDELAGAVDDLSNRLLETDERITITSAPVHHEVEDLRLRTAEALSHATRLEGELGRITGELGRLTGELSDLRTGVSGDRLEASSREARLRSLTERLSSLAGRVDAVDEAHRGRTLPRLEHLSAALEGLRLADPEEVARLGTLTAALSTSLGASETRLRDQADLVSELRRQLEAGEAASSGLASRVEALAAAQEGLERRLAEQAAALEGPSSGLLELRGEAQEMRDRLEAVSSRPDLSAELAAVRERLEQALAAQTETAAHLDAERTARDEEVKALRQALEEARAGAENARQEAASLRQDAASLRQESERLRDELGGVRALAAAQASSSREAIRQLREETSRELGKALEGVRASLEDRLATAEKKTRTLSEALRRALDELG